MIAGLQPDPVRVDAPRTAAPVRATAGNAVPLPGRDPPATAPVAGHSVIPAVDPGTGEALRQIPSGERLVLARWFAPPSPPVIDLHA